LANDDAVKLHLLGSSTHQPATPFFRGRQRLFDLAAFLTPHRPTGAVETPVALTQHLQTLHRPGKAIWISDFLFPTSEYQAGLNLLRAANLDIAVLQVLGRDDVDPPVLPTGARMVDSESGEATLVQFDASAKKEYLRRLDLHNRTFRSYCHQVGVHYALFTSSQDVSTFVLRELPALGILT
jgi:uncharacterized protein (DUF58 family)